MGGPGSQGALNTQQNGISFYNRNQGVHFHTLRANEFMYQDDLPNYSKIGVPAGDRIVNWHWPRKYWQFW